MGLTEQQRRRRVSPLISLCIFSVLPFFILLSQESAPLLPPSLKPLLQHAPAVSYPAPETPPEWKRPLTLTVHAAAENDTVKLVLFTTGVDNQGFGRSLNSVGCLIGKQAVPAVELRPAMVICLASSDLLTKGIPVTVAIEYDDELKKALEGKTQELGGEEFRFEDGDVTPLSETPKEFVEKAKKVASIKTLVKWHDGFIDQSTGTRHELCIMTAMRQYPYLLKDWIGYYRRMGVDKFYIYENWATEDLENLVGSDFVEVVKWPWVRSQMQSNNHFLLASKIRCKYVGFFDADEFAMVGGRIEKGMLKKYIKMRNSEGYTQVVLHFLMMLNNGFVRRPKGPLPELYTRREKDQVLKLGKAAIETDAGWNFHKIHMVEKSRGSRGNTYWNGTMELEPSSIRHNALLIHYTKRSWEEFVLKNRIGGASVMTKTRPKRVLDVDQPNEEYMDLGNSVEFEWFRERWRKTMNIMDDGRISLIRREGDLVCRTVWCPTCLMWRVGREECSMDGSMEYSVYQGRGHVE